MLTDQEKDNLATGNMIREHCPDCGTLVWETPSKRFLPRYTETIICPKCKRDCSRKAPFFYKVKAKISFIKKKLAVRMLK